MKFSLLNQHKLSVKENVDNLITSDFEKIIHNYGDEYQLRSYEVVIWSNGFMAETLERLNHLAI